MSKLSRRELLPFMCAATIAPATAFAQTAWYRKRDCLRAIQRGMDYLYRVSSNPQNFAEFGCDAFWTFHCLARITDPEVKQRARVMGRQLVRRWLRETPHVPPDADANVLGSICAGSLGAQNLGIPTPRMKEELRVAAQRFGPVDFMAFDPAKEPIPDDLSEKCANCGTANARGRKECSKCAAPVKFSEPYDTLTVALIATYSWDRYGLSCGGSLSDVCRHLPRMRPYRGFENGRYGPFKRVGYAVNHVVYAFNDFNRYRLKPEWLPQEYEFLKSNLMANLANDDPDLLGEFLFSLKSFGLTDVDPQMRVGIDFLLARQNSDGSWSKEDQAGAYTPYHATATAVCGLSECDFEGERVTFPEALRRAQSR